MLNNWEYISLNGATVFIRNGLNIQQLKNENRGLPITRIETIAEEKINVRKVGFANLEGNDDWLLQDGDILFSHINSEKHIGKTAIYYLHLGKLVHGMNLLCFRPKKNIIDNNFLLYTLKKLKFDSSFNRITKRAVNQASISINDLGKIKIPLPPLSEQRQIVEMLDQADELRELRKEADEKANKIIPALFYKMFGDIGNNAKGFPQKTIGDVLAETFYGTSSRSNNSNSGIPIIRMNNITEAGDLDLAKLKYIDLSEKELSKYILRKGDILFNRTNSKELVGKTGLWNDEIVAVPASYLIIVRVLQNAILPEYLWAYLNTPHIKNLLRGKSRRAIGMANINAQELKSIPIIIPPLELQKDFSKSLYQIKITIEQNYISKEKLDSLFNTLLQKAFDATLTAKWREGRMKELLEEMEEQKKYLDKINKGK